MANSEKTENEIVLWRDGFKPSSRSLPDCTPDFHPLEWLYGDGEVIICAITHKNYDIFMHYHDYCELNYIKNGKGVHYFGNNRFRVKKGDFFVIPPFIRHGYYSENSLDVLHVIINSKFLKSLETELFDIKQFNFIFNYHSELKKYYNFNYKLSLSESEEKNFLNIYEILLEFSPLDKNKKFSNIDKIFCKGILLQFISVICNSYVRQIDEIIKSDDEDSVLMGMISYISENISDDLSRKSVCRKFGYSESGIYRLFKRKLNTTFQDFVIKTRVEKSKQLLCGTNKNTAEIAQICGFCDSAHMIREFKKSTGMTPKQYKSENF